MTGKLIVGTIQDTAGDTVASTYVTNGVARSWAEFTISVVINDSFNVASMTDEGVGDFDTNLTNNMASTAYVALGDVENFNAYLTTVKNSSSNFTNYTSRDTVNDLADLTDMQNVIHGELA